MKNSRPLEPSQLRWRCDPAQFPFETTGELLEIEGLLGQSRAASAIDFGIGMKREGYNLYILGPPGSGKRTVMRKFLERRSQDEPRPMDWCYVNNFQDADQPHTLNLPAGQGRQLADDMAHLVDDVKAAIPATLDSDDHRRQVEKAKQELHDEHEGSLESLANEAHELELELIRTPTGVALAPMREGKVIGPEEFEQLSGDQRKEIEQAVEQLQPKLQAIVKKLPQLKKKARERVKQLDQKATRSVIEQLISPLKEKYAQMPAVIEHLCAVEGDVVDHSDEFRTAGEETPALFGIQSTAFSTEQYLVNLLVDHTNTEGAPVVFEDNPSYHNLIGRIEHRSQMGSLVTDFSLIKPGALHRANGGYIVLQVRDVLSQPYAWEGLKRALRSQHIQIESLGAALSLISTVSLRPEPIPLDAKVVLLGDRLLYYLLQEYDPDFEELVKVAADFNDEIDRTTENCMLFSRMLATLVKHEEALPMSPRAVAVMIEQAARHAGDQGKLSTHMRSISDLVRESDYWAKQESEQVITADHVTKAIQQGIYRSDRIRERIHEDILRGTLLVDTDGEQIGQVNGLSVIALGSLSFGRPARITATVRLGRAGVVDIDREADLGGAIHTKGVMIISSLLASRYAADEQLSLSASLVFEQSYAIIEGDSASVAEYCALLSALADVPIKQSLAITGSVNQHGEAQPVGGVNEKIEGFFDVCKARGLTGQQGVLIPESNVQNLMLRTDVVAAVESSEFAVYSYLNVDEALTLLTGVEAGVRNDDGVYPPNTLNDRIDRRLRKLSELQRSLQDKSPRDENDR